MKGRRSDITVRGTIRAWVQLNSSIFREKFKLGRLKFSNLTTIDMNITQFPSLKKALNPSKENHYGAPYY